MFDIKIDTSQWDKFEDVFEKGFGDSNLRKILNEAASYIDYKILERTSRGVDVDSKPFKPYTPFTVKSRREAGLPTDVPDLFFTGQMLGAMTHDSDPEEGRIFFMGGGGSPSPTDKMLKNNQIRPFFGVSDEDILEVNDLVEKEVDKIING